MNSPLQLGLIILALDPGDHLGHDVTPALIPIDDKTLIERALETADNVGISKIAVVTASRDYAAVRRVVERRFRQVAVVEHQGFADEVKSGQFRSRAIAAGWERLGDGLDHVMIHEAERALAPEKLFFRVIEAAGSGVDAAVPGLQVTDSVKARIRRDPAAEQPGSGPGEPEAVVNVDRSTLRGLQTPRVFSSATLRSALETMADGGSERLTEITAASRNSADIVIVKGAFLAFRIAGPLDIWQAQISLGVARQARTSHLTPERLRRGAWFRPRH